MSALPRSSLPASSGSAATANASFVLGALLLIAVGGFGAWVVGGRGIDIGTDTSTYALFFDRLGNPFDSSLEPGFVFFSFLLKRIGMGVPGFQAALFLLLLAIVAAASHRYFGFLRGERGYLTFLSAVVMLLYVSPMFVNASINTIRQGLAAPAVFAALIAFQQRRWMPFVLYGALSTSLHYSSLLYLACAPLLLLSARTLRYVAAAAFVAYCAGATLFAVRSVLPALYHMVISYTFNPDYRAGVRIDFALFSILWYVLPLLLAPLVRVPHRERLEASSAAYLVMLLPFFAIGWGSYSNRYLLPAWLAASLIMAAIVCFSRLRFVRNPLLIRLGLLAACPVFWFLVTRVVVI